MFRYRLVVVAAPTHRLAGARGIHFRDLARDDWFVDPAGQDPSAEVGALLDRLRVAPSRIRVFPSQTAALAAAAAGDGVAPAISHLVQRDIDSGRLVALDVIGTPIDLLWYASMLAGERRVPSASALRQFLVDPRGDAGDAPQRRRHPRQPLPSARVRHDLELRPVAGRARPRHGQRSPRPARGSRSGQALLDLVVPLRAQAQPAPDELDVVGVAPRPACAAGGRRRSTASVVAERPDDLDEEVGRSGRWVGRCARSASTAG